MQTMKSVELFVGAGGLGMGIARAGFRHLAAIEWNHDACEAIRENMRREVVPVCHWPLTEGDVRNFDYGSLKEQADLLAGGPPCQPFSLAGKHRGYRDERDMFPQAVRAIRELAPRAVILENVKGLTRTAFAEYLEFIKLQIRYPEQIRKGREDWTGHLSRLKKYSKRPGDLIYTVSHTLLNAADYGVPQKRERVFIVGFRSDLSKDWIFPEPTHSLESLLWDQWVSGEYWQRHEVSRKQRPSIPGKYGFIVDRLKRIGQKPQLLPWRTVRDAIANLGKPTTRDDGRNHILVPGARKYPGHTGSPLDEPAKTLKAGDHGVPGGENMLSLPDGSVRYFTVRESARLQTFPDDYVFSRSWTESMRQLGNAVPVMLGEAVARKVGQSLFEGVADGGRKQSARFQSTR